MLKKGAKIILLKKRVTKMMVATNILAKTKIGGVGLFGSKTAFFFVFFKLLFPIDIFWEKYH